MWKQGVGPKRQAVSRAAPVFAGATIGDMPSAAAAVRTFRLTLDLFDSGVQLMRQNLRRRNPQADRQEIERQLRAWLRERPGAEHGDCPGRPVDIRARLG